MYKAADKLQRTPQSNWKKNANGPKLALLGRACATGLWQSSFDKLSWWTIWLRCVRSLLHWGRP